MKKTLVFFLVSFLFSCSYKNIKSELGSQSNKIRMLDSNYSNIDSNSFINGKIFFIQNEKLYQIEAKYGYFLSYSKRLYNRDSVLITWEGEAYYQNIPMTYKDFMEGESPTTDSLHEKANFQIYYGKSGKRYRGYFDLTPSFTYKETKTEIDYFNKGYIKKMKVSNSEIDTVLFFKRDGSTKKFIIKKGSRIIAKNKCKEDNCFGYQKRVFLYGDSALQRMINMPYQENPYVPDIILPDSIMR